MFPKIQFTEVAPLFENLPSPPHASMDIQTMEALNQGWGSILYRTKTAVPTQSVLTITDAHDFAQVFINGKLIGSIDRRNHEKTMLLPAMKEGDQLDILVEAMGRINFGRAIKDFKGITEKVELSYTMNTGSQVTVNLKNWQIYTLSDSYQVQKNMKYVPLKDQKVPGCYRATFNLKKDRRHVPEFGNMGQRTSVRKRTRHRTLLENRSATDALHARMLVEERRERDYRTRHCRSAGNRGRRSVKPIIDKLNVDAPNTHRKEGQTLNLAGETPLQGR